MNLTLADTIRTGMNNPDCAFFVGRMMGQADLGGLILNVAFIYFGFKVLDNVVFKGVPKLYRWLKGLHNLRKLKRDWARKHRKKDGYNK